MEKIESFKVDHTNLKPGVYVSRKDKFGEEVITTFDLRFKTPNREPVMNTAEMHTIEHLGATFLRNDKFWGNRIIYFGPMGCRTGFYLIVYGDCEVEDVIPLLTYVFGCISYYDEEIPGATSEECGNYLDHNLPMARYESRKFVVDAIGGTLDNTEN